jgi:hypothetical protein
MLKNIKAVALFCLTLFLAVALSIAILAIWDVIENSAAKDLLIKTAYTFGAVFAVSAIVAIIKK